jgi:ribokinase
MKHEQGSANGQNQDDIRRQPMVLVIGSANMDMVVGCDRFPQPGETILARDFGMFPGGKGANQAVAAAKIGGHVQFIGKMGSDPFHDGLVASLQREGVQLDGLFVDEVTPTGVALITVDGKGENEIVVASGSNMKLTPADLDAQEALFAEASVVLVQLEIPVDTVQRAVELGRKHGATVILNPAPARLLPQELLRSVDYLTPNETEVAQLAGLSPDGLPTSEDSARALVARGVRNVVVTLGEQGALLVSEDGAQRYPACRVRAVDTTAGGDAFNGALAFGLAGGRSPAEAIQLANAVAGYAVTHRGAQPSMPDRGALQEFLHEHAGEVAVTL